MSEENINSSPLPLSLCIGCTKRSCSMRSELRCCPVTVCAMREPFKKYLKVELTYFTETGKYYSEGSYLTMYVDMHAIFGEVRSFSEHRVLPGLIKGHSDFIVLVNVPDHKDNFPTLIIPRSEK